MKMLSPAKAFTLLALILSFAGSAWSLWHFKNNAEISGRAVTFGIVSSHFPNLRFDDRIGQDTILKTTDTPSGQVGLHLLEVQTPTGHPAHMQILEMHEQSRETATKVVEDKMSLIRALYESHLDQYAGVVSKPASCTKNINTNRAKIEDEKGFYSFSDLKATSRFVYGSCETEEFQSQLLYLFCKSQGTLYEIKYFYPRAEVYFTQPIARCHD